MTLSRHTPLKATKGLNPGVSTLARTGIKRSTKDGQAGRKRKNPRDTGPSKATRDALAERSGGVCEICGSARAVDPHHRHGRKAGGTRRPWINDLSNLLHLCRADHDMVTNTNGRRREFEENGWVLCEGQDPAAVRVLLTLPDGTLVRVLLANEPGTAAVPHPQQQGGRAA